MEELISVIVPVYKVEKYLKKCIESIISQTYKKLEIILVDDGSPDNCPKICDEYAKKDDRIKVIHKKNGGLSDARNYGIDIAKGKYICFIDSDDYISAKFIETLYDDIKSGDAKISSVGYKKVNDKYEQKLENQKNCLVFFNKEDAIKQLFLEDTFGNYAWNKLYDIDLFNGIKFPVEKKMEDLGIMYLLFDKCDKISYNKNQLYYYVQREGSILHTLSKELLLDKLELSIKRYEYIKKSYPDMLENKKYIMEVCLDTYPILKKGSELEKYCKNIIKFTEYKSFYHQLTCKRKIKLFIYSINKRLYKKIFIKKYN